MTPGLGVEDRGPGIGGDDLAPVLPHPRDPRGAQDPPPVGGGPLHPIAAVHVGGDRSQRLPGQQPAGDLPDDRGLTGVRGASVRLPAERTWTAAVWVAALGCLLALLPDPLADLLGLQPGEGHQEARHRLPHRRAGVERFRDAGQDRPMRLADSQSPLEIGPVADEPIELEKRDAADQTCLDVGQASLEAGPGRSLLLPGPAVGAVDVMVEAGRGPALGVAVGNGTLMLAFDGQFGEVVGLLSDAEPPVHPMFKAQGSSPDLGVARVPSHLCVVEVSLTCLE